jgi:anti-anti-sigma factor
MTAGDDTAASLRQRVQPSVHVGHHVPHLAVVTLEGEHDLSTQPQLTDALAQATAHSHVLVDLSHCDFMDSTVISSLIQAAQMVHRRGEQLAVVIPPERTDLARVAAVMGLTDIFPLHPSRDAGLASLEDLLTQQF